MPYKDKEDRNEAVRRHRAKEKREKEQIEAAESLQRKLSDILKGSFHFNSIPYASFVKITQEGFIVEGDKVKDIKTGKTVGDMEVLYGLNMMVVVETLRMTVPE